MAFNVDFAQWNQSYHESMREIYGFGVDIPTEHRSYLDCIRDYYTKNMLNKPSEEVRIRKEENVRRFKSIMSKGVEAWKARNLEYYLEYHLKRSNFEKYQTLVSADISFAFFTQKWVENILDGHAGIDISWRSRCIRTRCLWYCGGSVWSAIRLH